MQTLKYFGYTQNFIKCNYIDLAALAFSQYKKINNSILHPLLYYTFYTLIMPRILSLINVCTQIQKKSFFYVL